MDIGELVRRSGVPASTLRLWEEKGLLKTVGRKGLRRQYGPEIQERVALIVVCQDAGFTLAEIKGLLEPHAFRDGKAVLEAKVAELEAQRRAIDVAIAGIRHALCCPEPNPLECDRFREKLSRVLPRGSVQAEELVGEGKCEVEVPGRELQKPAAGVFASDGLE